MFEFSVKRGTPLGCTAVRRPKPGPKPGPQPPPATSPDRYWRPSRFGSALSDSGGASGLFGPRRAPRMRARRGAPT